VAHVYNRETPAGKILLRRHPVNFAEMPLKQPKLQLRLLKSAPPRRKIIARIDDVVRAAQNIALSRFPIRGVSTANIMSGADPHFYWTGARRVTARAPIWRPYSVPTFVALRKWKPTSTRE